MQVKKKVLVEMLANPGKTFSRQQIANISGISQERSIDVMITRLRQKIEIEPNKPKFLQTIRVRDMFSGLNRLIKFLLPKRLFYRVINYCCCTNNNFTINSYCCFL